jgi:hypothetical protein
MRKIRFISKSILLPIVATLFAFFSAGTVPGLNDSSPNELYVRVTMLRGERSKDSHSETTTLTVSGDTLVYEQTYHGAHSGGRKPVRKEYKLSKENKSGLIRLLNEKRLLVTKTISKSAEGADRLYFEFAVESKLNGKNGAISIDGPRNATEIKNEPVYQDSLRLVNELYRIINQTDPDVTFEEFID